MVVTPEWERAHERLSADITKAAKKHGLNFRNISDLVNTNERYPELIPLLVDWLKHVEARSGLKDPRDLHNFRDGLYRALTTVDAMGGDVVALLADSFYITPPAPFMTLAAIGNALKYLAVPSDYPRMRQIAVDRTLSFGRAPVIEWLLRQDPDDAVPLAVGELDDSSVRPYVLRSLRVIKSLPVSLREKVKPYLEDPDSEVRLQVKKTLAHIDKR